MLPVSILLQPGLLVSGPHCWCRSIAMAIDDGVAQSSRRDKNRSEVREIYLPVHKRHTPIGG